MVQLAQTNLLQIAGDIGGVHMIHVKSHQTDDQRIVFNEDVDALANEGRSMPQKVDGAYVSPEGVTIYCPNVENQRIGQQFS